MNDHPPLSDACAAVRDQLASHIYQELDEPSQLNLLEHLTLCPDCRERESALREAYAELGRWSLPQDDPDTPQQLVARAVAGGAAVAPRSRLLTAAAVLLLAGACAWAATATVRQSGRLARLESRLEGAEAALLVTRGELESERAARGALAADLRAEQESSLARERNAQVTAVRNALARDRAATASWIHALGRGYAADRARTNTALVQLADRVVRSDALSNPERNQ